ncbi:MAG: hypothetical protein JRF49_12130 [Deltaproteobacteria bacterium]|nr:hypothetical protein [Deltaproteobacteria bacterium]
MLLKQSDTGVIGRETVDYGANINEYYVAYRLYYKKNQQRKRSLESLSAAQEG